MGVFGWNKEYKRLFGTKHSENEIIFIAGDSAVSVKYGYGYGVHMDVTIYQLE